MQARRESSKHSGGTATPKTIPEPTAAQIAAECLARCGARAGQPSPPAQNSPASAVSTMVIQQDRACAAVLREVQYNLHTSRLRQDLSTAAAVDAALAIEQTQGWVRAALHLREHRVSKAVTRRVLFTHQKRRPCQHDTARAEPPRPDSAHSPPCTK
ncbi:MAG TPA: hypothetical protein VGP06_18955 [Janthinobacterium sp.]|jgi:hypothetical protein|nr:hypothetical protein [Janthinobacterium sp.]